MIWLPLYAGVGVWFTLVFLFLCYLARKGVEDGTAGRYKREFHFMMERPELKLWMVGVLFFLWPLVLGLFLTVGNSGDDDDKDDKDDPQSRVPPEYR